MTFKEVDSIMRETKRSPLFGFLKASLITAAILFGTSGYLLRMVVISDDKCALQKEAIRAKDAAYLNAANLDLKLANKTLSEAMDKQNNVLKDLIFDVNNIKQRAKSER